MVTPDMHNPNGTLSTSNGLWYADHSRREGEPEKLLGMKNLPWEGLNFFTKIEAYAGME